MQKLMLLLFDLRAKLNKLTFPVFGFGQFSNFRTSKPQFQTENMIINNDMMPFFQLIGTGKQGRRIDNQYQPARVRNRLTKLYLDADILELWHLVIR